jgi:hypothetical protein
MVSQSGHHLDQQHRHTENVGNVGTSYKFTSAVSESKASGSSPLRWLPLTDLGKARIIQYEVTDKKNIDAHRRKKRGEIYMAAKFFSFESELGMLPVS